MNIFVTRHGETEWNTHWKLQGRSDTVLNGKGKEQAIQTRVGFEKAGLFFDRVYSSPLKRAVETAMLMTGKPEDKIIKDDRIIEFCFGKAEGKTPAEREADPELKDFHNFFDDPENFVPLEGCDSTEMKRKILSELNAGASTTLSEPAFPQEYYDLLSLTACFPPPGFLSISLFLTRWRL